MTRILAAAARDLNVSEAELRAAIRQALPWVPVLLAGLVLWILQWP